MNTEIGLHIHITGEKLAGKSLVGNIIKKALDDNGFENVTLIAHNGEPVGTYEPKTILDIVKLKNPSFFKTPITIGESTVRDYVDVETLEGSKEYLITDVPLLPTVVEDVEFDDIPY